MKFDVILLSRYYNKMVSLTKKKTKICDFSAKYYALQLYYSPDGSSVYWCQLMAVKNEVFIQWIWLKLGVLIHDQRIICHINQECKQFKWLNEIWYCIVKQIFQQYG